MSPRRTISELPHFAVTGTAGEPGAQFELSGVFDRLRGIQAGRGWLLFSERSALIGDVEQIDSDKQTAIFVTPEEPQVVVTGRSLPFLDGYWQAYHIWMVTDPGWLWTRTLFQAQDAVAERLREKDGKDWIRLRKRPAESDAGSGFRVYPGPSEAESRGIIQGGWDHEHCELCSGHIDAGHYGYVDRDNHWVCERCYESFVSVHDLAFLKDFWPGAF